MALTPDERLAGGLTNAARELADKAGVGKAAVEKAIREMPAGEANDTHRAVAIGKLMKKRT